MIAIAKASLVALLTAGLCAGQARAETASGGRPVMGTVLEISVVADDEARARELVERAFDLASHWDDVLTTWRAEGELQRLNLGAGGGMQPISRDLGAALARMLDLSKQTGGIFDPAVGPLVARVRAGGSLGDDDALDGRYRIATALRVRHDQAALVAGAALDAGGIGKGMALDAIARLLRDGGARAAYLDFGGSSQLAFGTPESGDVWRVAVAGNDGRSVLGTVALRDASLSTSRAIAVGDPSGSIIDPRNLNVIEPPLLASVVAADATTAEAWSTALVVLGADGIAGAQAHGLHALVEVDGRVSKTDGFPFSE